MGERIMNTRLVEMVGVVLFLLLFVSFCNLQEVLSYKVQQQQGFKSQTHLLSCFSSSIVYLHIKFANLNVP